MGYKRKAAAPLKCPYKPGQACGTCECRKRCFFSFLSPGSLALFRAERRMRLFKARQLVFSEGERPEGLYILCVGDAKMTKSDRHGRELIVDYLSCGDLFGEVSYFAGGPYGASAETLRESMVCFLPERLVERLCADEPELYRRLLGRSCRAFNRTVDRALGLAFLSAEARVAEFLIAMKKPALTPAALCPTHAYTRREIAENLGLSPETVIRALSSFRKRGLVKLAGRTVDIKDRTGLEAIVRKR